VAARSGDHVAERLAAYEHLLGFGVPADVLRRGADGGWRYLINNPFGTSS
jgi:hypothetical protein